MARAFGFRGAVTVEEVIIRAGEAVTADGLLQDPSFGAGPFRAPEGSLALYEATVHLQSRGLAPAVLIPWAFGTAACAPRRHGARDLGGLALPPGAPADRGRAPGASERCPTAAPARMAPPEVPRPRFP